MDWTDFPGSDIKVALTTTNFVVSNQLLKITNCPICVIEMGMTLCGFSPSDNEKFELIIVNVLNEMLTEVHINVEERTVIIGDTQCPLISYKAFPVGDKLFEDAFFSRWGACKTLMFEMQILKDQNTTLLISALYDDSEKKWSMIESSLNPKFIVFSPQNPSN